MGAKLPAEKRRRIVIDKMEGKDERCIALDLDVSQATVRNYARKARRVFGRPVSRWGSNLKSMIKVLLEHPTSDVEEIVEAKGHRMEDLKTVKGKLKEAFGNDLFRVYHSPKPLETPTIPRPVQEGDILPVQIYQDGEKRRGVTSVGPTRFMMFVPGAKRGETLLVKVSHLRDRCAFADVIWELRDSFPERHLMSRPLDDDDDPASGSIRAGPGQGTGPGTGLA